MKRTALWAALAFAAAWSGGCAYLSGAKDMGGADFEKEAAADDTRVREDKTRTELGHMETAIAEYIRTEGRIPEKLDELIPKYLAEIPAMDVAACGGESEKVWYYPAEVLRGGQVDGTRIRGSGRWGYVHDSERVVVFVDCLKPALDGTPWYKERGVY